MNGVKQNLSLLIPFALVMPAYATDYLNESQAQKVLFPEADQFLKQSVTLTDDQVSKIKDLSGVRQRTKNPAIWRVQKKSKLLGWFYIDEVVGKHEFITYATAVDPDGKVLGVEIMSYRETHGGEIRQEAWRNKFKGKSLSDPLKLDKDIPNITGATLSCRNVLDGVKRILVLQQVLGSEKAL
ncbi:FMN-binding protein [Bdellovibrio svalbardensis]|uniref:FMN-binding protein n=1 Tax=Bdellovibrio svalbardensis TaxID=2972972 RepID=A0ABT6DNF7_9BACT|nr:FMN-binding protein [Bdellovibrio svalbardensis]MDG0818181.1 FMN-binding protein [Bdellovibrio svalbardensis]